MYYSNNMASKLDTPNGGFPPIYICTKKNEEDQQKDTSKREYTTHKSTVSIKSILEKRRVVPFLKTDNK